jgi:hypothetical protein
VQVLQLLLHGMQYSPLEKNPTSQIHFRFLSNTKPLLQEVQVVGEPEQLLQLLLHKLQNPWLDIIYPVAQVHMLLAALSIAPFWQEVH